MTIALLDEALNYFYDNQFRLLNHRSIVEPILTKHKEFDDKNGTYKIRAANQIIEKLSSDGLLIFRDNSTSNMAGGYYLSFDGIIFKENGGYTEELNRNKNDRDFEVRKMRLELKQIRSTIITNRNVRGINNIQKILIVLATIFSAVSLWISYLTYLKDEVINVQPSRVIIQQLSDSSKLRMPSLDTLRNQE